MSPELLVQQNGFPPLVDGKTNPELIDDSTATGNFINRIFLFKDEVAGTGNAYLNKAIGTVDQDYSGLIDLFAEYRRSKDVTATTSELNVVCNDTARINAMSNFELLQTFTQIQQADMAVIRDKLRNDVIRLIGQDKYDQLVRFIETDVKSTMKVRFDVKFSDYPEETLNKLDRTFVIGLGCK